MARTSTETTPQRPPVDVDTSRIWPQGSLAQRKAIQLPLDVRQDARFVAARVGIARRPPAIALTIAHDLTHFVAKGVDRSRVTALDGFVDLGPVAALAPEILAWQVIELSSRLLADVSVSGNPKAQGGLGALMYQAQLFRHLHILQSSAAEATG